MATLDIPVRQVLIEARIVIVNDDFTRELGVRAGYTRHRSERQQRPGRRPAAPRPATDTSLGSALDQPAAATAPSSRSACRPAPTRRQPLQREPAGREPRRQLALVLLGSDYIVDLELSAAQAEGRGEVISSPRVITANQKEASIEQGVEIPYQESASSGATTMQFKKAVLSLKVTPQITPDNRIILDLDVKKDSVGQVVVDVAAASTCPRSTRARSPRRCW